MIITTDPRPDLRRRIDARLGQGEMLLAIATDETARKSSATGVARSRGSNSVARSQLR